MLAASKHWDGMGWDGMGWDGIAGGGALGNCVGARKGSRCED